MRRNAWHVLAAVAMVGLMNAAAANAEEDFSLVAYEEGTYVNSEISSLRAEIDSLHQRMDTSVTSGYDDDGDGGKGCGSCCDSCCGCCCCPRGGYVAGAELAWLKPHHSNGAGVSSVFALAGTPNTGGIEPDFDTALRLWVGYQRCDGLGVRARYWDFDHAYTVAATGASVQGAATGNAFHAWDTYVFDVEGYDSSKLGCYWDMTLSAGFRYVDYSEAAGFLGADANTSFIAAKNITGIGATTSLELRRQISCNLNGFANARWSVIMGDENNAFAGGTPGVVALDTQLDDVKFMYEAQAGVEYVSPICGGGWYYARAGFEVQYWDGFGVDNQPFTRGGVVLPSSNASVGFGGFFFSGGVAR